MFWWKHRTYRTVMKAIRNISEGELLNAAKKKKNSHGNESTYNDGFLDGAEYMRQKSIKENISLRAKILELKEEILKYRKECMRAVGLAKKLAFKLEQKD